MSRWLQIIVRGVAYEIKRNAVNLCLMPLQMLEVSTAD